MITITVKHTILDGNMGDEWNDLDAAAMAFAEMTKREWEKAISAEFPSADVNVSVDVASRTGGCASQPSIHVETYDCDEFSSTYSAVEEIVSVDAWDKFCDEYEG